MARRRKKRDSLMGDVTGLTGAGISIGAGSAVAAGLAEKAPGASVTPAFATMGKGMGIITPVVMGRRAIIMTQNLMPKKKKRRRY